MPRQGVTKEDRPRAPEITTLKPQSVALNSIKPANRNHAVSLPCHRAVLYRERLSQHVP